MKIKLFITYLFTIITTYASSIDKLCINFAKVLLGLSPDKHIAYVHRISYNSTNEIPASKYKYNEAPNLSRFNSVNLPLINTSVLMSYCKSIDSIIFIEKMYYSLQTIPLPLLDKTKWLVVLESPYKNGEITSNRILNDQQLKLLSEFKFINTETFFFIPYPQLENGICIQWDKNLFKIPNHIIQEKPTLVDDIAIMSSVLCAKQIDTSNVNILENLYDIKSKLQTKLGIKIYTEVCNILEANVIKSEFSPNKNSTLDFNEIERKLNKIK